MLFIVLLIIGVVLFMNGFKRPPVGMDKENKRAFENSINIKYLIGMLILIVVLTIMSQPC